MSRSVSTQYDIPQGLSYLTAIVIHGSLIAISGE
jgi:hypothetical protein